MASLIIGCFLSAAAFAAEPEATYRGNSQRTGSDGVAGPAAPKVLWTWRSTDHFIAAPVAHKDRLFVSGLGGFNVPTFVCLNIDPKAGQRVMWTKSAPFLKLPAVSSPAIHGDTLLFGDGMHQTDGAILHCLRMDKGRMVWQLPVPGTLVHLEGSPTIAGKRAYLGGGAAGVLCVDLERIRLDDKEMDLPAVRKILDKKWAELQAKYEEEKKKDPTLAVPPSEDDLPKPSPVLVWQQGKEKWHVDAPIAVAGERVFAAAAFLDKEKVGDRALYCLNAKTGAIVWRTPLRFNPWGGPSLAGGTVVVSGSTIGYDPKRLKGARGVVAAFDPADGKEKWKKDVPAGVVSCVALTNELAIAAATDGKVRAFDLRSGERRWIYDGKAPFFAPVAVSAGIAYAGDLRGVVHALNLADGSRKWTLDLAAEPVKAPGMIYAGPLLHGGRLFVATCNLEGPFARQATVVVCIGEAGKQGDKETRRQGDKGRRQLHSLLVSLSPCLLVSSLAADADTGLVVDKDKRTVTIAAKIAPRIINDPAYKREDGKPYPIEVIACWAFPKGKKAHETVVTIDVKPSAVHKALASLGLKPGKPAYGESKEEPQGPEVKVYLEVPGTGGQSKRLTIEKVLIDPKTNKPMPKVHWRFTGSALKQPDPNKKEKVYGADLSGTLISIFPVTDDTVLQTNLTMKEEKYVKLETNKKLLPKEGTTVKLILEVPAKK